MAGGCSYPTCWAAAHKKVLLFPLILSIGGSSRTGARPAASVIFAIPRLRLFSLLPRLAVKQDLRPLQGAAVFWIFSSGFLVPGGEIWYTNVINMEDSAPASHRGGRYPLDRKTVLLDEAQLERQREYTRQLAAPPSAAGQARLCAGGHLRLPAECGRQPSTFWVCCGTWAASSPTTPLMRISWC